MSSRNLRAGPIVAATVNVDPENVMQDDETDFNPGRFTRHFDSHPGVKWCILCAVVPVWVEQRRKECSLWAILRV
jgi:hypothetical protein